MMQRSIFRNDLFSDFARLQRQLEQALTLSPSIRGIGGGSFPAMNVGTTPESFELYTFVPGIDPDKIEVNLERGVLTVDGERKSSLSKQEEKSTIHINERFAGRFRRVTSLPNDIDPDSVSANYVDGVLHVSIKRQEAVQPRRISVN